MKPLPKKLEEDLENAKYYRGGLLNSRESENVGDGSRRRNDLSKAFDDSMERAMYDEILGPMLRPRGRLPAGSGFEATKLSNRPPSSESTSDFTTSLLQRLQKLEIECKEQRTQLASKISENQRLSAELESLKLSMQSPSKLLEEIEYLAEENQLLEKKCHDMEHFLSDYGLIWVGNETSQTNPYDENTSNEKIEIGKSNSNFEDRHRVSYAEFLKHINALNEIIFSEPTKIIADESKRRARLGHSSELMERIKITFYANGLMIKRGPFRSCSSESYISFMKDVIDGYFPSEFREIYPEGVIFDVVDKHDELFHPGQGNDSSNPPISAQQFLDKVPKTVVRNGEIIDMRQELRLRLHYQSASHDDSSLERKDNIPPTHSRNVHQLVGLKTRISTQIPDESLDNQESRVVHIHIKGIPGITFRGSFYENDTVADIKEAIQYYYESNNHMRHTTMDLENIEIRTSFPPKLLFSGMTLQEAGLVPTGTVYMKL